MTSRSGRERPVKIDKTFQEAIGFFAVPESERSRRRDSEAEESDKTKEAALKAALEAVGIFDRQLLADMMRESQTREDTSGSGGH